MLALLAIFLFLCCFYLFDAIQRPRRFPPGPIGLPIVGNLLLVKKLARKYGGQHLAFLHLAKEYNSDIIGLKLGTTNVVVGFGPSMVKAFLTNEDLQARPNSFFIRLRCMGAKRGVTCTDGETWTVQRGFVTKHLRELGFGKARMDYMIRDELHDVIDILTKDGNRATNVGRFLAPSVLNVLWALVSGNRLSRDDPQLSKILTLFNKRSKAFDMSGGLLNLFPSIRFVAPELSGYNLLTDINTQLKKLFTTAIEDHLKSWYPGREDDLIYSYITEMKSEDPHPSFNYDQLTMVCLDLFLAGSETTSNTLAFAILLMILNPDIQEKARHEIYANLDKTAELCYMDRMKLPYVEAVIMEVERYRPSVPIQGPRNAMKDITFGKYHIPKDSTILISMHSVFMDPEIWGDPEVFRPERFLNEEGKLIYHEHLLPFGLGKRRCLGEVLARSCLFMLFAGILRNFKIVAAEGTEKLCLAPLPGITSSPKPYKAIFQPYNY